MNTKAELEAAEAKLTGNAADRAALFGVKDVIDAEIAELKAKLAQEQKPKLRHGDYGFSPDDGNTATANQCRVTLNCDAAMVTAGNGSVNNTNEASNEKYYPFPVLGNIFDDLKALQEDVTEFEMSCEVCPSATVKVLTFNGRIQVGVSGGCDVRLSGENLTAFILKLRQMEATLKRR